MAAPCIKAPRELFALAESSSFNGSYDLPGIDAGPDSYRFDQPLSWRASVTNTGAMLMVTGTVSGQALTACARCLDDFSVLLEGSFEGYFVRPDDAVDDQGGEDDFFAMGPDDTIDLAPLIVSALLLEVPLQPLCSADCQGLCPTCGANLNRQSCDCASRRSLENQQFDDARNPFAVLRTLYPSS